MDTQKNYTRNIKTAGHCLCWAHARRKFVDAAPAYAKETDGLENTLVKAGIDQISQLFDKEKEYKSLSPEERYERRLREEKPIPEVLFAWAENNVDKLLPKSPLATAMNYLLSNRDGLVTSKTGTVTFLTTLRKTASGLSPLGGKTGFSVTAPREPKPVPSSTA